MTHNHTRHNALRRALPLLLGMLCATPALADKADPVGEVSTSVDAPDLVSVPAPVSLPVNVWVPETAAYSRADEFVIVPA